MLPIVVVRKVSIDFPKQQVCMFRGIVRYILILLWGGAIPPPPDHLSCCLPWGLSFSVPSLYLLFLLCQTRLLSTLRRLLDKILSPGGFLLICLPVTLPPLPPLSPPILTLPLRPLAPRLGKVC